MKHTTHNLTNEQKEALFNKHKDLISLVHMLGDMALRKQIKTLYCMLHPDKDITTVEFDIAELIVTGFLLQVQIQKPSKTQMLYLSKYPRSHFYNKETTGDVPALNFTNSKVYNQIFRVGICHSASDSNHAEEKSPAYRGQPYILPLLDFF